MQPRPGGFPRRRLGAAPHQFRVKAAPLGQGSGKYRPIAVDNIRHKQQWNLLLPVAENGGLQRLGLFGPHPGEDRTHQVPLPFFQAQGSGRAGLQLAAAAKGAARHLHQLQYFFFQGHFMQQTPQRLLLHGQ